MAVHRLRLIGTVKGGRGRGLKERGYLINFLLQKGGGGGLLERGSLIEDLQWLYFDNTLHHVPYLLRCLLLLILVYKCPLSEHNPDLVEWSKHKLMPLVLMGR